MCTTCGCGSDEVRVTAVGTTDAAGEAHGHVHAPGHHHAHEPDQAHGPDLAHPHEHEDSKRTHTIDLEQRILAKNDRLADQNRQWLARRGITAVNLMSSPGAGKTSLLERTIHDHGAGRPISVVEGDQETIFDATRIREAGAKAVQINTGAGCHLDAPMVRSGLEKLEPDDGELVFLENVGNLVCPALFDLGEARKVVVISVTEGDDKPLKYPHMFAAADLVVINKVDLLPYVDFDVDTCAAHARSVNPDVTVLPLSVTTGDGLQNWYAWLREL